MITLNLEKRKMMVEVLDHAKIGINAMSLRKENGLTLREMSAKMGISISYLCDLEHGRKSWNKRLMISFIKGIS